MKYFKTLSRCYVKCAKRVFIGLSGSPCGLRDAEMTMDLGFLLWPGCMQRCLGMGATMS